MGCLTRVVGGAALVVVAAGAWWLAGGTLPAAVTDRVPALAGRDRGMSSAPSSALASARWQSIDDAGLARAQSQLAKLESRTGPAFVALEAGELAAFLVNALARQLPASARGAMVAVINDRVYLKADVPLDEFGGASVLGPLAGVINRRDTVTLGGTFEMLDERRGQFRIREVVLGEFGVPTPLIGRLISTTRRGDMPPGLAADAYPVTLPPSVADLRISRGQITVYKAPPITP